nr:hypothetical protein [Mycoplasmopsis bovis]
MDALTHSNDLARNTWERIWLAIPAHEVNDKAKIITQKVGLIIIVIVIRIIIDGTLEIILIIKVIILSKILKWPIIIPIIRPTITWINVAINDKASEYLSPYHNLAHKSLPTESVPKMWPSVKKVSYLFSTANCNGSYLVTNGIISA